MLHDATAAFCHYGYTPGHVCNSGCLALHGHNDPADGFQHGIQQAQIPKEVQVLQQLQHHSIGDGLLAARFTQHAGEGGVVVQHR